MASAVRTFHNCQQALFVFSPPELFLLLYPVTEAIKITHLLTVGVAHETLIR